MRKETKEERNNRHAKISEGVAQIGRLIGVCAQNGLDQEDILIMLQTSTSLTLEVNDIDLSQYLMFLYILHNRRLDPKFDGSDVSVMRAELRKLFTAEGEGREFMI